MLTAVAYYIMFCILHHEPQSRINYDTAGIISAFLLEKATLLTAILFKACHVLTAVDFVS